MTKARDIASATTPNANAALLATFPHKNLIINSAMTVSQRGNSTGITSSGYYGPDRYQLTLSNLGTWSISQSSTAPSGFGNSYKLEATTNDASPAAGDYAIFLQKFEGQNLQQLKKGTASAESVTLSFWVRSSKTGTYIVELFDNDNSRSISASYTISVADTFEYKTITFAGDTTGAFDDDNASSLEVIWYLAAGSTYTSGTLQTSWGTRTAANQAVGQVNMADTANATWYITGVQLELGSTVTPFEHRSYDDELTKCQRYYWAIDANNHITDYPSFVASAYSSSQCNFQVSFPVQMRTVPTMTYNSGSAFYRFYRNLSNDNYDNLQNDTVTQWHVNISSNGGLSHTAGTSGNVQIRIPSGGGFQADAEL